MWRFFSAEYVYCKEFVAFFNLKKRMSESHFQIFSGKTSQGIELELVITGNTLVKAAMAAGYVMSGVAVNEDDVCIGYAFCQLQEQPFSNNMVQFKSLFIDDLCVDQEARGQHIGESLFEYVKSEAKQLGCYEVTLNVWAGNTPAEKFYEKIGMRTKERQMEYIL